MKTQTHTYPFFHEAISLLNAANELLEIMKNVTFRKRDFPTGASKFWPHFISRCEFCVMTRAKAPPSGLKEAAWSDMELGEQRGCKCEISLHTL